MKDLGQAIRDGVAELYPGRGITAETVGPDQASVWLPWLAAAFFGLHNLQVADWSKAAGLFSNFAGRPVVVAEAGRGLDGDVVFVVTDGDTLDYDLRSIAVPALGCGLGGLEWDEVYPLIVAYLGDLDGVRVLVYPPAPVSRKG